ncbi:histidinol-phosphate transaminase [Photobacterium damselae]|uniref:histidinol-phosphate transaminase n=1 Tax=Photobacterium damselae TaxID=38293 RepID=UPI0035A92E6E
MKFENEYIKNITPYKLASHKVWDEVGNDEILKLDWNEATIPASPIVKKRVLETIDKIGFRYYPNVNNTELNESLSKYTGLSMESILYFASSDYAQEYIVSVFLSKDDNVLILGPTYDNFRLACQSRGAQVHYTYYDNEFKFNLDNYKEHIGKLKPKVAYICNPNNPTGTQISSKIIEDIVSNHLDTLFIIDEAYIEFSSDSCSYLIDKFENVIISRTFSKAFALANFRIGYLLSSKGIIDSLNKIRNAKNINSLSQEAAIAALSDIEYTKKYVDEVLQAKEYMLKKINNLKDITAFDSKGNFLLIKCLERSVKLKIIYEFENNNIFVRDLNHNTLSEFYFRITIGTLKQMERVVAILENILNEEKNEDCIC